MEFILAEEAFNESQRAYRATLESRAAALTAELAELQSGIEQTTPTLAARGGARVEFATADCSRRSARDGAGIAALHSIATTSNGSLHQIRKTFVAAGLEVREPMYAERFGAERVEACDVVDRDRSNDLNHHRRRPPRCACDRR